MGGHYAIELSGHNYRSVIPALLDCSTDWDFVTIGIGSLPTYHLCLWRHGLRGALISAHLGQNWFFQESFLDSIVRSAICLLHGQQHSPIFAHAAIVRIDKKRVIAVYSKN